MGKSRKSKRSGGKHLGKLVKRGRSRKFRRSRFRKRRSGRN